MYELGIAEQHLTIARRRADSGKGSLRAFPLLHPLWSSKDHGSFIAERDYRIDSRRPPGGNVAGSERDAHQQKQNGTNRERIERAHIEKLAHQNASESQRNNQARKQAKTRSK